MGKDYEITDELWEAMEPLLPPMKKRKGRAGRPLGWGWRMILNGIFYILRTGCQWSALPVGYPPKSTVHYRFQILVRDGFFQRLTDSLAISLEELGIIDLEECAIDGMFTRGKFSDDKVGYGKQGKGSKAVVITDKNGLPVSISIESAEAHEVTRVEDTLDQMFTIGEPEVLLADKAYDSDLLDETLREERGIELIAPHKDNRVARPTQDGRSLRRNKRRWKVERFNSWIQNYRRIPIRYEKIFDNYLAMFLLGIADILSRKLI
jgi:transposase